MPDYTRSRYRLSSAAAAAGFVAAATALARTRGMTNAAGAAIVNAVGPIRQVVQGGAAAPRRYLVIAPGSPTELGTHVQVQVP